MKKNFALLISLCSYLYCYSQHQGNTWYFGEHCGIDFNSGSPTFLLGGQTQSYQSNMEGCSTISDSTGNLLFYCDGRTIWNHDNIVMENGDSLLGDETSSQACLIVPQPKSSQYFYVFTTDCFQNNFNNGLRYSIVDICADSGLGAVTEKNILLMDDPFEKLAGVQSSNGIDYWIVSFKFGTNAFYSFLLTENGITDTVISAASLVTPTIVAQALGEMKFSPNGKKLAMVIGQSGTSAQLFDFNDTTGTVSNAILLPTNPPNLYGVAFSPDNSKLYIAEYTSFQISQFDLSNNFFQTIIPTGLNNPMTGLQLAPDGKIYCVKASQSYLSVIDSPNNVGVSCNFILNGFDLLGHTVGYALPNFVANYSYHNSIADCRDEAVIEIEKDGLKIFPNPADNIITIEASVQVRSIYLFSSVGDEVNKFQAVSPAKSLHISVSDIPSGLYLVSIQLISGETIFRKLIVQ